MVLMRLLDRYPHLLADARTLGEGADLRGFKDTVHKEHETLTVS